MIFDFGFGFENNNAISTQSIQLKPNDNDDDDDDENTKYMEKILGDAIPFVCLTLFVCRLFSERLVVVLVVVDH